MSAVRRFIGNRSVFAALTVTSAAAWAVALALQYGLGMQPCSLCILQRWALTGLLIGSSLGWAMEHRWPRWKLAVPPALSAAAGLVVAGKHLWLQLTPHSSEVGCGFGGELLLENFPLSQALPALFAGSGDCATLPPVAGAPLPLWTLLYFAGAFAVTLWGVTHRQNAELNKV